MAGYESKLKTFPQRPYYDDFAVSKKFYQLLFRPGLAVQARELTQMQTILQDQIARMGSHFFDNGAKIIGGETSVKKHIEFMKLPLSLPSSSNYDYTGGTVTKGTLVGNITHYIPKNSTDPGTIYVEYSSSEGTITSFNSTAVYSITLTAGGSGYSGTPTINIAGTGTGATAVATITAGVITSITITNGGTGYTSAPTITISGTGTGATATAEIITDNLVISATNTDTNSVETFTTSIPNASMGYGALVTINDGVYYVNGRFVAVDKQTLVVSKYTPIITAGTEIPIGFLITDRIVTPEEDNSLYDNAIGSTNESAPGATRYTMDVELAVKPDGDDVKNFIQLMVLREGVAATPPNQTDYTSIFLELFARRTYDQSGDFIVNDFLLDLREHLDDDTNRGVYKLADGGDESLLALVLDPGKAYVRGYEIETLTNTTLTTDKSRDVESTEDIFISNPYDSYVYVDLNPGVTFLAGHTTTTNDFTLFDRSIVTYFKSSTHVNLFSAVLMGIEPVVGTKYKIYFTQLKSLQSNSNLANVAYIDQSSNYAPVVSPGSGVPAIVASQAKSSMLYPIPLSFVRNITGSVFRTFKSATGNISGDTITLPPDSTLQYVSDADAYTVQIDGYGYVTPTSVSVSGGAVTLEFAASYPGVNYTIWANVGRKNYSPKIKTLNTQTDTFTYYSTASLSNVFLSKTDVRHITSITIDGVSYTASYGLDSGQRNDVYGYGRIWVRPGFTIPAQGTIVIQYTYFSHGPGDFFTVDSYSALDYKDIPFYNGIFLGNVMDLRTSVADTTGITRIVPSTDIIIDYSYYLSRMDYIVLNNKGLFSVVRGIPSLNPKVPKTIDNAITLYELRIPAYTFHTVDVNVTKLNYKRYTNKDISNLEKRIESLEYYTQLSLLESDIQGKEFLDKFKSGFIVDNFESLTTGDVENTLHTTALDFAKGELRPESVTTAINVVPKTLTNCVNNNGLITLPYTSTNYIKQELASTIVRIQPFAKFNWKGNMTINPPFDNWISTSMAPDLTLDAGIFPSQERANVLNNKIWDVAARVFVGNEIGNNVSGNRTIPVEGNVAAQEGGRIVSVDRSRDHDTQGWLNYERTTITSQTNYVGTRVVDVGAVPYIRSRWIEFTVTGLKPNTVVTPYFDGANVSKYCYLGTATNPPQTQPDGNYAWIYVNGSWVNTATHSSTDVFKSNGAGVLHGWFLIPSNNAVRFKTGTRKLQVVDVLENPTTQANATYIANGTNITFQNVFITTRFAATDNFWYDPLAQSFAVSNPEGVFIESADIFFGPEASSSPDYVTVQIRNMVNGYPGDNVIATVEKLVNQGSYDATVGVQFNFNHLIYLEPNKEYALVVLSNSTDLSIWCSELGQKSVRPGDFTTFTGEYINKQPYLGSLFKSQNARTWTAEQTQDMKFRINRAKFDTNEATVVFSNKVEDKDVNTEADIFKKTLSNNPLSVTYGLKFTVLTGGSGYVTAPTVVIDNTGTGGTGATATAILGTNVGVDDDQVVGINITSQGAGYTSAPVVTLTGGSGTGATVQAQYFNGKTVTVRHENHGYKAGDVVTLTFAPNVSGAILGGFTTADLAGNHTITSEDIDWYQFVVSTGTNTQTIDSGGGQSIIATQVVPYSYVRIMTDAIVLNGNSLLWKLQTKGYYSSSSIDAGEVGIAEGKLIDLGQLKVVSKDNDSSMLLKGVFKTNSDYLSPVIDADRVTVYGVVNRINDKVDARTVSNVLYYDVNNAISRYATKNISLVNPSNELQVYLDMNLLTGTDVDVYCMVSTTPVSVSDITHDWQPMTLAAGGEFSDIDIFKETKFIYESPSDFTNFVIKVVLSTTVTKGDPKYRAVTPRCKRFRAIALKT